jgi:DNA-binding NarL/FixJ family response regulator
MTQTNLTPIKVVLVDDHKVVRGGLRMLIENETGIKVVGEAGTVEEAVSVVSREEPDVIVLDLDLRGESGLDLLPQINAAGKKPRVLILTGERDPEVHRQCVKLGARGLVHKELASEVLIKAIKKVNADEIWFDRSMMSNVLNEVLNQKNGRQDNPEALKIASLTAREKQAIDLVCLGLKNKQIADRLFISDTTVRHHLTSIFSKLDVSDRLELVIYSYRHGLGSPPK